MPTTIGVLRDQVSEGVLSDLEQITPQGEGEEAEYIALMWAADASARMLRGPGRRVVAVAELDSLGVNVPTPLSRVIAWYADPHERPVEADPDEDLCWYAAQEIDAVLGD